MYSVDSSHTLVSQDGKDGGAGWGLVAARDCAADEALITLPAPLLLSYDERVDAPLRNLIDKVPPQLWAMRLGLRLLTQRAQVSVSVGRRLDAKERERERERSGPRGLTRGGGEVQTLCLSNHPRNATR
jgi:hypothetical protein